MARTIRFYTTTQQPLSEYFDGKPYPQTVSLQAAATFTGLTRNDSQLAVRWKVGQDAAYAKASIKILNAWASTLVALGGNDNLFLAAGLYGYQLANAGEIMRAYSGWSLADQKAFGIMLNNVFAGWNADFINTNASNPDTHFFANWDICNMASLLAIGIFNDNQTAWDYVMNYFYEGGGYGDIFRFTIANFTESGGDKRLVQGQEAGRDQGHATLDFMLYGVFAQQAWNQGVDIFGAVDSDILAGCVRHLRPCGLNEMLTTVRHSSEYCSKYNVGQDVPFTAYQGFTTISNSSRGVTRPGFELLYAHYDGIKGQNASWTGQYRDKVNDASPAKVEGGGGNYGTTSGGYDGLGFGTLLFRRD